MTVQEAMDYASEIKKWQHQEPDNLVGERGKGMIVLAAEVKRLQEENTHWLEQNSRFAARLQAAEAEVERLREELSTKPEWAESDCHYWRNEPARALERAETAEAERNQLILDLDSSRQAEKSNMRYWTQWA